MGAPKTISTHGKIPMTLRLTVAKAMLDLASSPVGPSDEPENISAWIRETPTAAVDLHNWRGFQGMRNVTLILAPRPTDKKQPRRGRLTNTPPSG